MSYLAPKAFVFVHLSFDTVRHVNQLFVSGSEDNCFNLESNQQQHAQLISAPTALHL